MRKNDSLLRHLGCWLQHYPTGLGALLNMNLR
jgi:hypothetical protein